MYPPSGEYFGLPSYAKLPDVIFRGRASGVASDNSHRSLFVELAGCGSGLDTKHNSELSGAKAYCTGPPSWNGGESKVPGVRSRTAPEAPETSTRKMWVRVPSFQDVQCL